MKTNFPKYQWTASGDDGVLLGEKYAIKITSYDQTIVECDTLFKELQLPILEARIITPEDKSLWIEVGKALNDVEYKDKYGKEINHITQALVMNRIRGVELHKISLDKPIEKETLHQLFHDIGKLVVIDLYVRNYDRFPLSVFRDELLHSEFDDVGDERWIPWDENPENIFIDITSGRAIPIDSASYFKGIDATAYRTIVRRLLSQQIQEIMWHILTSPNYARLFCPSIDMANESIIQHAKQLGIYAKLHAGMEEAMGFIGNKL